MKSSYEPAARSSRFFISDAPLGTKRALRTGELCADLGERGRRRRALGLERGRGHHVGHVLDAGLEGGHF